jgi:hypothetical protein
MKVHLHNAMTVETKTLIIFADENAIDLIIV